MSPSGSLIAKWEPRGVDTEDYSLSVAIQNTVSDSLVVFIATNGGISECDYMTGRLIVFMNSSDLSVKNCIYNEDLNFNIFYNYYDDDAPIVIDSQDNIYASAPQYSEAGKAMLVRMNKTGDTERIKELPLYADGDIHDLDIDMYDNPVLSVESTSYLLSNTSFDFTWTFDCGGDEGSSKPYVASNDQGVFVVTCLMDVNLSLKVFVFNEVLATPSPTLSPPPSMAPIDNESNSNNVSIGVIVGVTIGATCGIVILGFLGYFLFKTIAARSAGKNGDGDNFL